MVRGESREAALEVSRALIEGGVLGIEITFTTPEAHSTIQDLKEEYDGRILLGAGTLTTPEQVELSASAGATFLVSPGLNLGLVSLMQDTDLLTMPGTLTPSDIMLAQELGLKAVKLFPGSLGGPSYLKALRGPFPDMKFLPTGGVSLDNIKDWFEAGALAVGVGSTLAPAGLETRDRGDVVARAREFARATQSTNNTRFM